MLQCGRRMLLKHQLLRETLEFKEFMKWRQSGVCLRQRPLEMANEEGAVRGRTPAPLIRPALAGLLLLFISLRLKTGSFSSAGTFFRGVFWEDVWKYSLLILPVRANYQLWTSVPIGQSLAYGPALLSNCISLRAQPLSKLPAQGCYIREAAKEKKLITPPPHPPTSPTPRARRSGSTLQPQLISSDASENGCRRC